MQWLIDLIIETIGIPPTFIDRGDPITYDYTSGDFTKDGLWNPLDLSDIVPTGATAVLAQIDCSNILVQKNAYFKKFGQIFPRNVARVNSLISGVAFVFNVTIIVDSDRKCEYNFDISPWLIFNMAIRGWWL